MSQKAWERLLIAMLTGFVIALGIMWAEAAQAEFTDAVQGMVFQ